MTNDTVYDSIFAGHFTNEAPGGFGISSLKTKHRFPLWHSISSKSLPPCLHLPCFKVIGNQQLQQDEYISQSFRCKLCISYGDFSTLFLFRPPYQQHLYKTLSLSKIFQTDCHILNSTQTITSLSHTLFFNINTPVHSVPIYVRALPSDTFCNSRNTARTPRLYSGNSLRCIAARRVVVLCFYCCCDGYYLLLLLLLRFVVCPDLWFVVCGSDISMWLV